MAILSMNYPMDVPWKLIAVSQDMMDTQFCDKQFPFAWRSSLAISAYEPTPEDMPDALCDEHLSFLKVTCTITGYQPSRAVTKSAYDSFPNVPSEDLMRVLGDYFACYGVLLNVAVFPYSSTKTIKELKRISIDFGPQTPGTSLPNPYQSQQAVFETINQANNRISDINNDQSGELRLSGELVITIPASSQVEAKLIQIAGAPVTMQAYKGSQLLGSQATAPNPGQVEQLKIEAENIDRIVIEIPEGMKASLVEFAYYTLQEKPIDLKDYPHIIDFQPKTRDFYQAATETGEILTASVSEVKTSKSFTNTNTTETGLSLASAVSLGKEPLSGTMKGEFRRAWGETDQDNSNTQIDSSRDRRERQSTTTNLSQMYNLLTGYHKGTNRAVFLMLPRPYILQPTDYRTFIQGLRVIEGIQEFFLIVARPKGMEGLCVEAFLETGHFPEGAEIIEPEPDYDRDWEDFLVTAYVDDEDWSETIEGSLNSKHIVADGWVIDRKHPESDPGHAGIKFLRQIKGKEVKALNYQPITDSIVQVFGDLYGDKNDVELSFRVFTRSDKPKRTNSGPKVTADLIITSRCLCACFKSGEDCPEVVEAGTTCPSGDWIVEETVLAINPALLTPDVTSQTRLPALKELLSKIHSAMTTSGRLPTRQPFGKVGFLESDYFKNHMKEILPVEVLETTLGQMKDLPQAVTKCLGKDCTVAKALEIDLHSFTRKTGLSLEDAVKARHTLLGLTPTLNEDETTHTKEHG